MILERNGIKMSVERNGNLVVFQILEQSESATKALKLLGHVRDDSTGLTLRSNKGPSFNHNLKRFFVRGTDTEKDNKRVKAEFASSDEAYSAVEALSRLLDKIVLPETAGRNHNPAMGSVYPGGTSHVRFYFINRAMATHLQLTGHKLYPESVIEWEPTKPIFTVNRHYNEHIAQGVDVLNKSIMTDGEFSLQKLEAHIINEHRVNPEQARKAVKSLRDSFQEAFEGGYLVAYWRMVTAIRGPDFEDDEE